MGGTRLGVSIVAGAALLAVVAGGLSRGEAGETTRREERPAPAAASGDVETAVFALG